MQFHERIRALREDNDIKQKDIAKLLNMNQRKVSRLETKATEPTPDEIIRYCKIFNVTADYILGLSDKKNK